MGSAEHVLVLKGGISGEREVSLRTGEQCAAALRTAGYRVSELDVTYERTPMLGALIAEAAPDVVFNALHGKYGEDGTVQGLLELMRIPYTHSGVLASSVAMSKPVTKTVLRAAGVPVVDEARVVHRLEAAREHAMARPYVLKPADGGSSLGVFIVREDMEHPPQELWSKDWAFGDFMLAERFVHGMELTCAAMGERALDVIEILQDNTFYDYEAKYAAGGSRHVLPARIQPNVYQDIQKLTLTAHRALGCRGVSRADFRFDDRPGGTGEIVCLEVNTQPGMTRTSLVPELAEYAGISFPALVTWMVEDASCDR